LSFHTGSVRLSKHHGLANDFLVLVDPDGSSSIAPEQAVRLCDRHTGVGADGLLWAGPGRDGAEVSMVLLNADGSRAEMSGNGIRCLAQAVAVARGVEELDLEIATDAGIRSVSLRPTGIAGTARVRVGMGVVSEVEAADLGLGAKDVLGADVGNPHVVALFPDRDALDVAADRFGRTDRNVEFIVMSGPDELELRVIERGVGETQACGTGACAAAWAARRWGLVGDRVRVVMPGGAAEVELGAGDGDPVSLTGPTVHIADIVVAS
jgi:diaminopimelate epimerase